MQSYSIFFCFLSFFMLVSTLPVQSAVVISPCDIYPTLGNEEPSGNGMLNLTLFTESSGNCGNGSGDFNVDEANTDMPMGSVNSVSNESFVTSIGELRIFYQTNFPDINGCSFAHSIFIAIDLNQTAEDPLYLDALSIVLNYDAMYGDARDNPWAFDVPSNLQNDTDANFSGGIILGHISSSQIELPFNIQGAGWADYLMEICIDPFDPLFCDSDRILFHWESHGHIEGGETIFLTGVYEASVSEPSSLLLFLLGIVGILPKVRLWSPPRRRKCCIGIYFYTN